MNGRLIPSIVWVIKDAWTTINATSWWNLLPYSFKIAGFPDVQVSSLVHSLQKMHQLLVKFFQLQVIYWFVMGNPIS